MTSVFQFIKDNTLKTILVDLLLIKLYISPNFLEIIYMLLETKIKNNGEYLKRMMHSMNMLTKLNMMQSFMMMSMIWKFTKVNQ
jgi:hypothetical protein